MNARRNGLIAAWLTPLLMGFAPILGKGAYRVGVDPFTLAALRTLFAALLLWALCGLAFRQYLFIFPAGLFGTALVGITNGIGSLLFYNGLLLLHASVAQLLFMLYVIFGMLITRLYGHAISRLNLLRAGMATLAVYLLTGGLSGQVDLLGVGLVVGGAFMYALHVLLSQRVMYEMPAPTMALYAMTFMGLTLGAAQLVYAYYINPPGHTPVNPTGWELIGGLAVVTCLSRITLFAGVKNLGGMAAILLNVAEVAVTLIAALALLGEYMSPVQWVGAGVMLLSMALSYFDARPLDQNEIIRRLAPNLARGD
jgi:drug/metabolite transporter (DMT)-like permease